MRIAGASTTAAPSARSRAASALACARARVTAMVRPASGPVVEPGELVGERRDRADERDRRGAHLGGARGLGDVAQRRAHRALAGQRPALDDRRRLVRRRGRPR